MYRRRLIFINSVMAAFIVITATFQLMGYTKVFELNFENDVLESISYENEISASVGETVQYN